jgi:hypothetical protein
VTWPFVNPLAIAELLVAVAVANDDPPPPPLPLSARPGVPMFVWGSHALLSPPPEGRL